MTLSLLWETNEAHILVEGTKPMSLVFEACLFQGLRQRSTLLVSDSGGCAVKSGSWALPSIHGGALGGSLSFPILRVP